jgi:hypothetical protein
VNTTVPAIAFNLHLHQVGISLTPALPTVICTKYAVSKMIDEPRHRLSRIQIHYVRLAKQPFAREMYITDSLNSSSPVSSGTLPIGHALSSFESALMLGISLHRLEKQPTTPKFAYICSQNHRELQISSLLPLHLLQWLLHTLTGTFCPLSSNH